MFAHCQFYSSFSFSLCTFTYISFTFIHVALANEAMDQKISFMTISDSKHEIKYPLPTI
jgi:hypothetical protein